MGGNNVDDGDAARTALLRDGYFVIRGCVDPEQLAALRDAARAMAAQSAPSLTGTSQPRVSIDFSAGGRTTASSVGGAADDIDVATATFVGFCLSDAVLGRTHELLGCGPGERVAIHQLQIFINTTDHEAADTPIPPPGQDWGTDPRNWHRDMRPDHDAPLDLLLRDHHHNGPSYLQWNIALLDSDRCLHVLPGSHNRHTAESELIELQHNPQSETLPGAINAQLNAGDGVAYINTILHRGSDYSPDRPRLTLHLAYRAFDRPLFPRSNVYVWDTGGPGLAWLPAAHRKQLHEMAGWQTMQMDTIERLLRAVLDASSGAAAPATAAASVHSCLGELHRGIEGREVALVLCAVQVRDILATHRRHSRSFSHSGSTSSGSSHGGALSYIEELASQFSADEIAQLATAFAPLEKLLKQPSLLRQHVRGFLGPPTEYVYDHLTPQAAQQLAPDGLTSLVDQLCSANTGSRLKESNEGEVSSVYAVRSSRL